VDRCRDQVVLQARGPARRAARPGSPERRARGSYGGRQDREVTPVGLGSVPVGGTGGRVFADGAGRGEGKADRQGAGGELSGIRLRSSPGSECHRGDSIRSPTWV
jgi:hypothetical protein